MIWYSERVPDSYLVFCKFKLSPFTRLQKASLPSAQAQLTVTVAGCTSPSIFVNMVQNLEKRDTGKQETRRTSEAIDTSNTTYIQ